MPGIVLTPPAEDSDCDSQIHLIPFAPDFCCKWGATPNSEINTMKPQEQFALALRIIGVLSLMYLLRAFVRNASPPAIILIIRLACAVIAVLMIRGAPALVKFAYPDSTPANVRQEQESR